MQRQHSSTLHALPDIGATRQHLVCGVVVQLCCLRCTELFSLFPNTCSCSCKPLTPEAYCTDTLSTHLNLELQCTCLYASIGMRFICTELIHEFKLTQLLQFIDTATDLIVPFQCCQQCEASYVHITLNHHCVYMHTLINLYTQSCMAWHFLPHTPYTYCADHAMHNCTIEFS